MEDGVNGKSVSSPGPKEIYKAGWLKRSSGLLGLWKDRYIQILKTQLLICDDEDNQKCLETLELANYERCQDQKAFLKRKRHFTLIPSSGTKVQDVKFQAKNVEERDAWIQALNDGINRGKNKALDEVTVDTSCSLEHVTRDRVKVAATKRRPPTRIHLKEVAEAATDDSLRLGLEALDTGVLTIVSPMPKPKDAEPEPVKEPKKIPMPPTKSNLPQTLETNISDNTDSQIQAGQAPAPPPKSLKENVHAREKLMSQNEQTSMEENSAVVVSKRESTENLDEFLNVPPKPPPKNLSKIKWDGSSSDIEKKEDLISYERGSKENLVDFESDELDNPSVLHQVELLEDVQTNELSTSSNSLQEEDTRLSQLLNDANTDEEDLQEASVESACQSKQEETNEMENIDILTSDVQGQLNTQPTDVKKVRYIKHEMKTGHMTTQTQHNTNTFKASSMGDLLSPSQEDTPRLHLTKDHLDQVKKNLASGKERALALLNQIATGQLSNGDECNPETLLKHVIAHFDEASEICQGAEEKEPINISTTSHLVTEKQKERQRELMALQRRSVPF